MGRWWNPRAWMEELLTYAWHWSAPCSSCDPSCFWESSRKQILRTLFRSATVASGVVPKVATWAMNDFLLLRSWSRLCNPLSHQRGVVSPVPPESQNVEGLNCFFFLLLFHLLGSRLTGDILTHNALSSTMRCPLPSLVKVLPSLQNKQRKCIRRAQLQTECTSKREPLGDPSDESRFQWTLCFEACFLSPCEVGRRNIPLVAADTKECWGWEILSNLPVPQQQSSGCVL